MIRPSETAFAHNLDAQLSAFSQNVTALPGVDDPIKRWVLVEQLIESKRRVDFVATLQKLSLSDDRANPHSDIFDPIRGAITLIRRNDEEEAFWLLYLATQFSKHSVDGWKLTRAVYGRLGTSPYWKWPTVSAHPSQFADWVSDNYSTLKNHRFGNHRKYETLKPNSRRGLGAAVKDYVERISVYGTQRDAIERKIAGLNDPHTQFERLFSFFNENLSWGRLATFDHVTMLQKVGLIGAIPGRTFLNGATGPRNGVDLLLSDVSLTIKQKESVIVELAGQLKLGQQEMEDALCNWQKSPSKFIAFR
jgi:hypothetical protein